MAAWDDNLIRQFLSDIEGDQFLFSIDLSHVDQWFSNATGSNNERKCCMQQFGEKRYGKQILSNIDSSGHTCDPELIRVVKHEGGSGDNTPVQVSTADRGQVEEEQVLTEGTSSMEVSQGNDLTLCSSQEKQLQNKAGHVVTQPLSPEGTSDRCDEGSEVSLSPVAVLLVRQAPDGNKVSSSTSSWIVASDQEDDGGSGRSVITSLEEEDESGSSSEDILYDDTDNGDGGYDGDVGTDGELFKTFIDNKVTILDVQAVTVNGDDTRGEDSGVMPGKPVESADRSSGSGKVMTFSGDDILIKSLESDDETILSGTSTIPWLSPEHTHLDLSSSSSGSESLRHPSTTHSRSGRMCQFVSADSVVSPSPEHSLGNVSRSGVSSQSGTVPSQADHESSSPTNNTPVSESISQSRTISCLGDKQDRCDSSKELEEQRANTCKWTKQLNNSEDFYTSGNSGPVVEYVGGEDRLSEEFSVEEHIISKQTKGILSGLEGADINCKSCTAVEHVKHKDLSEDSSLEEEVITPRKRNKRLLSDSEGSETICKSSNAVEQVEDEDRLLQNSSLEEEVISPCKRSKRILSDSDGSDTTCKSSNAVEQVEDEDRLLQNSSLEEEVISPCKRRKRILSDSDGSDTTCKSSNAVEQVEDEDRLLQNSSLEEEVISPCKRSKRILSDSDGSDTTCKSSNAVEQVEDEDRLLQNSNLEEEVISPCKRSKRILSDSDGSDTTCKSSNAVEQVEDEDRLLQNSSLEEEVISPCKRSKRILSDPEVGDDDYSGLQSVRCADTTGEVNDVGRRHLEEENVENGEEEAVDKNLILSPWEEKHGRRETKRKLQLQLMKKLQEVKKNWKDRRSIEGEDKIQGYKRTIKTTEDSGPTENEASDHPLMSDSEVSQNSAQESSELEDSCMTDFIDSQESAASLPSLASHLPQLMGRGMNIEDAFDHFLSVFVNGALDMDFLQPECLKTMDDYESLIKPALLKIEGAINTRLGVIFSSAWKANFREVLLVKPHMWLKNMDCGGGDCQACELRDHPYTKECTFSGPLYDRETLAEVDNVEDNSNEEDDSNENDSSQETPTVNGNSIVVFKLGKFCARRSSCYHKLYHYKYNILQKCRQKVSSVKTHRLYRDEKDIFDQCMNHTDWKGQMMKDLLNLLDFADSYTQDK